MIIIMHLFLINRKINLKMNKKNSIIVIIYLF